MAKTRTLYPTLTKAQADDLLQFNAPNIAAIVADYTEINGHFYYYDSDDEKLAIVNDDATVEVFTETLEYPPLPTKKPSRAQRKLLEHVYEAMLNAAERNADALDKGNKGACVADGLPLQLVGHLVGDIYAQYWKCRSISTVRDTTIRICVDSGWVMRLNPENGTSNYWVLTALGLHVLGMDMPMAEYLVPTIKPRQRMVSTKGRLYTCTHIEFEGNRHTYHFKGMYGRKFARHNLDGLCRWLDDGTM